MKSKEYRAWVYAGMILMQSMVYGIGNPLTKAAYKSITPFWLLTFRFTAAFLLFICLFGKRIFTQLRTVRLMEILPASLCMALAYILCNVALNMTSATTVGFMMSLTVIISPILSVLILKTKYTYKHLPIQLFVLVGVFLLTGGGISANPGDIVCIAMAFFLAGSLVYGEKSLMNLDAIAVSAAQTGMTAVISLICALLFDNVNVIAGIKLNAWLTVCYLAVFCTCLAYFLQNEALANLKAGTISMLQCTQPILTAVCAFLMLGETMSPKAFAGAVIILICVFAENLMRHKAEESQNTDAD